MNKKTYLILLIVAIVIVIAVAWWIMKNPVVNAPSDMQNDVIRGDSVEDITQDLNEINLGDLEEDFEEIDKDINSL